MNLKNIVTEIVELKTVEGVSDTQFVKIVDILEKEFHSKQAGFINTELIQDKESSSWMMIQHWSSINDAKASSGKMFQEVITEDFRKSLDPHSVKIRFLPQIKTWEP